MSGFTGIRSKLIFTTMPLIVLAHKESVRDGVMITGFTAPSARLKEFQGGYRKFDMHNPAYTDQLVECARRGRRKKIP